MPFALDALGDLDRAAFDDLIDVRSPAEFAEDHLPGALNLPALTDAERARIGTIYTREDRFKARRLGAALLARNAARHLEGPLADRGGGWRPLLYCWRGGQRSGGMATILAEVGWRVETLAGGYRAFRRLVARAMHDTPLGHRLILLDGHTGTAKTDLLHRLAVRGLQVLDLEGIYAHRGSVFGAMARDQPAQKAAETAVAMRLARLDPGRPVLVEAESARIGERLVPPAVWTAMKAAPRIRLTAPLAARARYLARAYADVTADSAALAARIEALRPFQPAGRLAAWHELATAGAFGELADELMVHHYDPRYAKSAARHGAPVAEIDLGAMDAPALEAGADAIAARLAPAGRGAEALSEP